jgi:hypothetical protein
LYLLYDVVNSIIKKEVGYTFNESTIKSNIANMLEHCHKYFPIKLDYVESLFGSRPIPVTPVENVGDCRKTRIKCHSKYPGIYSILEGKFISAPLVAETVASLVLNNKP